MNPPASAGKPAPGDAAARFDRAEGLSATGRRILQQAAQSIRLRRADDADAHLASAGALAPAHPEVLRLRALVAQMRNQHGEAANLLRRVVDARPFDALPWNNLGTSLAESGDVDGAIAAFRRSAELAPQRAAPWFNLGRALDAAGRVEEAHAALTTALARDPAHVGARLMLGRVLQFMGRIDEAEAEFRRVLAAHPESAMAWYGLSTVRTARLDADETRTIERVYARDDLTRDERIGAGFALAKALEDQGRYTEAFAVLTAANATKRRTLAWDARTFTQYTRSIDAMFAGVPSGSAPATSAPVELGREVIFVFGLPRSGSTLVEQILAAHPEVNGANELEELKLVMDDESKRRGSAFPLWVPQMGAADWERLGRDYLARTAHWRRDRPVFTDKGLMNWTYVGALRAMLPGARFVNTRRDAVENCLACFRQSFARELGFTYDLAEMAAFWRDYDRLMRIWQQRYPGRIHDVVHERLVADPENGIRALLEACGLPFDEACLRFHEVERNVRTASAAQVRQPLRADTARAERYGRLLDPLRAMLAEAPSPR
jgi:tetratricopeptide (TPR) repeat protein